MKANDKQVGGKHYQNSPVQHWDWAQHKDYLVGLATKYLDRHKEKNGIEDVSKALHTIQKLVERDYPGYVMEYTIRAVVRHPYENMARDMKDGGEG